MSQSVLRVCLRVCRGCVSECVVAVSQSVLWLCLRVCCGYVSECVAAVSQSVLRLCLRLCLRMCCGCVSECVAAVSQSVLRLCLRLCLRMCCGCASECVAAVSQSVQPDGMVPTAPWRVEGAGATARVAMTAECVSWSVRMGTRECCAHVSISIPLPSVHHPTPGAFVYITTINTTNANAINLPPPSTTTTPQSTPPPPTSSYHQHYH